MTINLARLQAVAALAAMMSVSESADSQPHPIQPRGRRLLPSPPRIDPVDRVEHPLQSKFRPHQGAQEIARRKRQMERDEANRARRALYASAPDESERYDCPIHGTGAGADCPRC